MKIIPRAESNLATCMLASASLAFALMGDAFLYSFLPINAGSVELPLIWVGTILSINRFIRILLNPLILRVFSNHGFKTPTIVAAMTAVITTACYGIGFDIQVWLLLRILWGISYSILRVSALTYALDYPAKGLSLGVSQSIAECGPLLALLAGPYILDQAGPKVTFIIIGSCSAIGIYFAFKLQERQRRLVRKPVFKLTWPTCFNCLAFMSAFSVEGLLIVLIGSLLGQSYSSWTSIEITAAVGGFLSFRRICSVLISPLGGWLADRYGLIRVFSISILLICVGLVLVCTGFVVWGLVTVFTFYNINSSLAAGGASLGELDRTHAVSQNATYRDAGAAFGALTAGFLLTCQHPEWIFILCCTALIGLIIKPALAIIGSR